MSSAGISTLTTAPLVRLFLCSSQSFYQLLVVKAALSVKVLFLPP